MERMRPTNGFPSSSERKFDILVQRKLDNAAAREEVLSVLSTAEDLEKDRYVGELEGHAINSESTALKCDIELEVDVCSTWNRVAWLIIGQVIT